MTLTNGNIINEWVENVSTPILSKCLEDEKYYFYSHEGKGFGDNRVRRKFDAGKVMMDHPEIFHPILHPSLPNLITAFYVDGCPLIYCNENYGERVEEGSPLALCGYEFYPLETVFSWEWIDIVERNKEKFPLTDEDLRFRGKDPETVTKKFLATGIIPFSTEKDLFLNTEEAR